MPNIRVCCCLKSPAHHHHHHDTSAREVRHARMQNKTTIKIKEAPATLAEPASQPSQVHTVCTFLLQLTTTTTTTKVLHLTPPPRLTTALLHARRTHL